MEALLRSYIEKRRCQRPSPGVAVPAELARALAINGKAACEETVTDGGCGLHAFALSMHEEAQRNHALRSTSLYKDLSKKMKNAQKVIRHLRDKAYSWMVGHADDEVWEGMVYCGEHEIQ